LNANDGTLQVGHILESRYRIVSEVQVQEAGQDYKAYDMHLDCLVVITVLDPRLWSGTNIVGRLANIQKTLTDLAVPALLPYERVGEVGGQLYLVRSHVVGHVLADLIHMLGVLEGKKAAQVAVNICDALAPAHRAGLIHGGLSPSSIVVADDGQVTLLDTGLFSALRPDPAVPGQPWGRLPYVSPEQAAGEDAHPASDVYAVGLLLYEMLAGRPPFRPGDDAMVALQHLRYDPPSLQVLAPNVPLPLAQIVHKSLSKEPSARYRNAGQLAHILRAQFGLPEAAQPLPDAERQLVVPPPPSREIERAYQPAAQAYDWSAEPTAVDWVLIGLLIAALVAVLGLIPLWRVVYRSYALPPPAATPVSHRLDGGDRFAYARDDNPATALTNGRAKLDVLAIVVYNPVVPPCDRFCGFGSPDYGLGSGIV